MLKARDYGENSLTNVITDASLKDSYGLLLVIRCVLRGQISMSRAEFEDLQRHKKLFKLARHSWYRKFSRLF